MPSVTLEEAQARLPQLIEQLQPGEEITITEQGLCSATWTFPSKCATPAAIR